MKLQEPLAVRIQTPLSIAAALQARKIGSYGSVSKPWYLVNPKIAGKWMFIPLKMVLIGIDPYPDNICPSQKPSETIGKRYFSWILLGECTRITRIPSCFLSDPIPPKWGPQNGVPLPALGGLKRVISSPVKPKIDTSGHGSHATSCHPEDSHWPSDSEMLVIYSLVIMMVNNDG